MRFFQNADYPFLEWRKRAYVLSVLALLVGIGAMVVNHTAGRGWMNYGVDFTGGTSVHVRFAQEVTDEQVRAVTEPAGNGAWEITRFGSPRDYVVRLPAAQFTQEVGQDAQTRVAEALRTRFGNGFQVVGTEAVGPRAGADLQQRALIAILLSFVGTLIYLWFRFEWRFGLAAIVATLHDILITLGFLAVTRTEISLATVAAVLTIVGYSLNDTIVVFDRVRENLSKPRHGRTQMQLLNLSINETLPRTTLTAGSVIGCLIAILVFGGPNLFDFALVLLLGIVIGTFSSIFVASPALFEIERIWPRKEKKRDTVVRTRHGSRDREASAV